MGAGVEAVIAPEPVPDEPAHPPRRAVDLVHENALRSARHHAVLSLAGTVVVAIALVWSGLRFGTSLWLFLGMLALAAAGFTAEWWQLRRRGPVAELPPEVRAVHTAALERHQAILAARPPRLTWGLLGCIGAATACQLFSRDSIAAAALVKPLVRQGEWWRLLSAAYLHGGPMHFWFNAASLRALGPLVEAYAPRLRLPLVWLVSALAGSLASYVLMPHATSLGASAGILGLVGYLWVMAQRRPHVMPPWFGRGLTVTIAINAFLGLVGFAFIDNAAHAGGTVAGALMGFATIPRTAPDETAVDGALTHGEDRYDIVDAVGALAACLVVLGAIFTIDRLLSSR